jgi:hypothetical protein
MSNVELFYKFCIKVGILPADIDSRINPEGYTITKIIGYYDLQSLLDTLNNNFDDILVWCLELKISKNKDDNTVLFSATNLQKQDTMNALKMLQKSQISEMLFSLRLSKQKILTGKNLDVDYLNFFIKTVGINEDIFENKDTSRSKFEINELINAKDKENLYVFNLEYLKQTFPGCVSVELYFQEDVNRNFPIIKMNSKADGNIFMQNLDAKANQDGRSKYRFILRIDKDILGKQILEENTDSRHIVFLFEKNLTKYLNTPVPSLDIDLFEDDKYSVIVALQGDILHQGRYLSIVSYSNIKRFNEMNLPAEVDQAHADMYREMRQEKISWNNFSLNIITPLHFICECIDGKRGEEADALATKLFHTCILYTANLSSYDIKTEVLTSKYCGLDQTAKILLDEIPCSMIKPKNLKWMAEWVYYPDTDPPKSGQEVHYSYRNTERLDIFQTVVTRNIADESLKESERFHLFEKRFNQIKEQIKLHYRMFLEGQIDKHTELVFKLEEEIAGAANNVSAKLDTVTKGFIDMLLSTIGIIIIAFIGALIKKDTSVAIIKISLWIYSVFLLIFHLVYRMWNIRHSYKVLTRGIDERLEKYKQTFGTKKIEELTTNLRAHRTMFTTWYWVTFCLYLIVIALLVAIGKFIPQILSVAELV